MLSSPSWSEIARHHPALRGHAEMLEVDAERVGHLGGLVCVCVVPVLVELGGRRLKVLSIDDVLKCQRVELACLAVNWCLSGEQVLCHDRLCRHSQQQW